MAVWPPNQDVPGAATLAPRAHDRHGLPRSRYVILILFVEGLEGVRGVGGSAGRENDQLADRRILSRGGGAFSVAAFPERLRRLQSGNRCSRRIVRARPCDRLPPEPYSPWGSWVDIVYRETSLPRGRAQLFDSTARQERTAPVSPYRAARCWPSATALCSGRRASQSGVRWLPRVWRSGAANDRQADCGETDAKDHYLNEGVRPTDCVIFRPIEDDHLENQDGQPDRQEKPVGGAPLLDEREPISSPPSSALDEPHEARGHQVRGACDGFTMLVRDLDCRVSSKPTGRATHGLVGSNPTPLRHHTVEASFDRALILRHHLSERFGAFVCARC